jgi:hypothetical protein
MFECFLKRLMALCALGLLCIGASACGSASPASRAAKATSSSNTSSTGQPAKPDPDKDSDGAKPDEDDSGKPPPPDKDNDADSNGKTLYDSDDSSIVAYGHAANASDKRAIAALAKLYYAAAAAEQGARACAMLYSPYAESVPETYGRSGPAGSYARGATCAVVMTGVFKRFHEQIAERLPKLQVSRVRVKERQGVAVLRFGSLSKERELHMTLEGHTWRVVGLIDNELP